MIVTEEWRPVSGFPGYRVSNLGRVQSLRASDPRTLRGSHNGCGYRIVYLAPPTGGRRKFYVHHLVAEVFIGPRPKGLEVRHLDGDSTNNASSNLAYGTRQENEQDKRRHGTAPSQKTHCIRGHLRDEVNTRPDGKGGRYCVACLRIREAQKRGPSPAKTACRNGHPYDNTNTYVYAGKRHCRVCHRANQANYLRRVGGVA